MVEIIFDTIDKGGVILVFLFGLSVYAWFLAVKKYFFLKKKDTVIASTYADLMKNRSTTQRQRLFKPAQLTYYHLLDKNTGVIKTISILAPLLGLLGTVNGMMRTFSIIKLFGSANPVLMADGISEALVTTQAGLITAFPIILGLNYLNNRIKEIKESFEKIELKIKKEVL